MSLCEQKTLYQNIIRKFSSKTRMSLSHALTDCWNNSTMIPGHFRGPSSSSTLPAKREDSPSSSISSTLKTSRNRACLYQSRFRTPSYHCQTCNRSFTSLILFQDHKQSHTPSWASQLGVFGLPIPNSVPLNPGIRWGSLRLEEWRAGCSSWERDLSILKYLHISSDQSVQFNWRGNPFRHLQPCSYSLPDRHAVKPADWKVMLNPYLWKDEFRHYRVHNMISTSRKRKYWTDQPYCVLTGVKGNGFFTCGACPCHPSFDSQHSFDMHNRKDHPLQMNLDNEAAPYRCDFCLETAKYVGGVGISPPQHSVRGNEEPRNPFAKNCPSIPTFHPPKYTISMPHRMGSGSSFLRGNEEESPSSSPHTSTLPSCTLPLRDEQMDSDAETEFGANSANNEPPVPNSSALANINDETFDENGDSQSEEVDCNSSEEWRIVPKKRRLYYDGVEVLRCTSALQPALEYLRCSICNHTVSKSRKVVKGRLPASGQLKEHIKLNHKTKVSVRKGPPSTPKRKQLNQSTPKLVRSCPICDRPIKGSMDQHLFSHKNDEERRTAIENWEKGTTNRLLRRKIRQKKKSGEGQLGFSCSICKRTFERNCYLASHMLAHRRKMKKIQLKTC